MLSYAVRCLRSTSWLLVLCTAAVAACIPPSLDDFSRGEAAAGGGPGAGAMKTFTGGADGGAGGGTTLDGGSGVSPGCGGLTFCDGFESGGFEAWDSTLVGNLADATVVHAMPGVVPFRGMWMLQSTTRAGGTDAAPAAAARKQLPSISTGLVSLRSYVFFTAAPPPTTTALAIEGTGGLIATMRVSTDGGTWEAQLVNSGHPYTKKTSDVKVAVGTWSCIALDLSLSPPQGFHLFVDGKPVLDWDVNVAASPTLDVYTAAAYGIAAGAPPATMFTDEAALLVGGASAASGPRIGCDP